MLETLIRVQPVLARNKSEYPADRRRGTAMISTVKGTAGNESPPGYEGSAGLAAFAS
jgi:hypothetical protein